MLFKTKSPYFKRAIQYTQIKCVINRKIALLHLQCCVFVLLTNVANKNCIAEFVETSVLFTLDEITSHVTSDKLAPVLISENEADF